MFDALNSFEIPILDAIGNIKCGFFDAFFPVITRFADKGIGWIAIAVILLLFKRTRKTGFMVGAALLIGLIFGNGILKPLFDRERPYEFANITLTLIAPLHDGSFPSGHTLASFEAATVLMLRDRRMGIPALVLAFVIAFSRLYLYVHYPSDVLAGILLGVLFGVLGVSIVKYGYSVFEKRKNN